VRTVLPHHRMAIHIPAGAWKTVAEDIPRAAALFCENRGRPRSITMGNRKAWDQRCPALPDELRWPGETFRQLR